MLYTVLLLPVLTLTFTAVLGIATLQLHEQRLRWALDMAALDAVTAVDPRAYSETGRIQLDPDVAANTFREYLVRNLRPLGSDIGGGYNAVRTAAGSEVSVVNAVPARDPFGSVMLDRPAVCARIHVSYHDGFLAWFHPEAVTLELSTVAEVRP
jgi:hypothetical protein